MRAMILAAGRGERMRPLTDHVPKPLLVAGGKPLIEHQLERLSAAGFRHVVINHAYLGQQIVAALGDGSRWGLKIHYSPESRALDTGGGIFHALHLLGPGAFLVVNADIWIDRDFGDLHRPIDALAHLVLVENPPHHPGGDFALEEGLVSDHGSHRLTFSGVGIYRPELFAGCEPGIFPLAPLLRRAMSARSVTGELHRGAWMDIGTPERLQELSRMLKLY